MVLPFVRGVPLEKLEAAGERGRCSDEFAGLGGAIVGLLSYDNIIEEILRSVTMRGTASE